MYKIEKQQYKKVLHDSITKSYKKATEGLKSEIDKKSRNIAKNLQMEDRIEQYTNNPAYVTFKDHNENFMNKLQCRLINPAKDPIGNISKTILDNIISKVKEETSLNLWKNTDDLINWFTASPE